MIHSNRTPLSILIAPKEVTPSEQIIDSSIAFIECCSTTEALKQGHTLNSQQQKEILLENIAKLEKSIVDEPVSLLVGFWKSEIENRKAQLQELEDKEREAEKDVMKAEETAKGKEATKDIPLSGRKKRKGSDAEMSGIDEKKGRACLHHGMDTGTNIYDLYSVLVHSGSAMGGHYYAYIKSFEKNKWHASASLQWARAFITFFVFSFMPGMNSMTVL